MLAAGLDGIENGLDPGEPNSENLYAQSVDDAHHARVPQRCRRTCSRRSASSSATTSSATALGRGRGEDYVDYYAQVKRDEWFRYHEQVTDWELREYLTRF